MNSINPVFVTFSIPEEIKVGELSYNPADIVEKLSATTARFGYGIGNPANPVWDGTDIPFSDPLSDIPWGKAILCEKVTSVGGDVSYTPIAGITGTTYGVTVKDKCYQLNAGLAVSELEATVSKASLVLVLYANVTLSEETLVESGESPIAISSAIDPTIFHSAEDVNFQLPKATGGYTFTVRGNLLGSTSVYTSLKDTLTTYPVSQAILAAKA